MNCRRALRSIGPSELVGNIEGYPKLLQALQEISPVPIFFELIDFGGRSPERAHANDAGADVFSPKDAVIRPGDICKLPLGFGLKIPDGYAGYIFPRSGLSSRGIVRELPPIDSGYTGEVHAIISNVGNREYEIKMGDKVGQLVIMPVLIPDFTFENWKERGTGAFGSTGR